MNASAPILFVVFFEYIVFQRMSFRGERGIQFHKMITWGLTESAWLGEEDICLHDEGELMGNDRNYGAWCDICSKV